MTKEIEIFGREMTSAAGNKFTAWRAKKADGTLIDCRFTKDVKNVPDDKHCIIVVDSENANISKSGIYPVLWVKKINDIKGFEKKDSLADF